MQIALQLLNLSAVRQQVGNATETALQQMRAEVSATVAAAQAAADAVAGGAEAGASTPLAVASAKARQTAQSFVTEFYDKKVFDQWLEFNSDEDRKAYEEREKERQREIQEALAAKTDAGNARALQIEREQLNDAADHGAKRSPQYQEYSDNLDAAGAELKAAMGVGKPTAKLNAAIEAGADDMATSKDVHGEAAKVLKQAGVVVADQSQTGHGVTVDASIAALLARG